MFLIIGIFVLILTHNISFGWSRKKALNFANFEAITRVTRQTFFPKSWIPLIARSLILLLLILAASGLGVWYTGYSSDFDYILVIDASGSMLANDYDPNRLEAAKEAAISFVDDIQAASKIGVVSFAGSSFVVQTLADEKANVKDSIDSIQVISVGGTAIGDSITLATNMFKTFESDKGRSVILLTDGQSNVGISVEDAVEYANNNGITINTLGVGTEEGGIIVEGEAVLQLDASTLEYISSSTGGNSYIVKNKEELRSAYIDILSSTKTRVFFDATSYLILIAFILLLGEWLLSNTKYKTIV